MVCDVEMTREPKYLHFRAKGMRSRESILALSKQIMDACIEHDARQVLVDVRELEGFLPVLDAYEIPAQEFPAMRRPEILRQAAVIDREGAEERGRFFETVAQNRGFNLRTFQDPDEAIEWLLRNRQP